MCHKVTRMESLQHPLCRCKSLLCALQETVLVQIFNVKRGFFLFTTCVMMNRRAGMKANIGASPLPLTATPPKRLPSHHRTREPGTWHLEGTARPLQPSCVWKPLHQPLGVVSHQLQLSSMGCLHGMSFWDNFRVTSSSKVNG